MAELKVGGEVDAFCTKCKMVLAHTTLAVWAGQIKRVRCNTCMGEHVFRKAEPGASSPSQKPSRPRVASVNKPKATGPALLSSYEELLEGKDRSAARPFNLKQKFAVGDLVQHPTFGLGVVAAARGLDKIDVAFPGSVKTLQHNKAGAPATFAKPLRQLDAVTPEDEAKDPAAETSDEPEGAVGQ